VNRSEKITGISQHILIQFKNFAKRVILSFQKLFSGVHNIFVANILR